VGDEMGIPIRINEAIYKEAKKVARAECRSIHIKLNFGRWWGRML